MRIKRVLIAAAVAVGGWFAALTGVAEAFPPAPVHQVEGCVATYKHPCVYVAKRWGGIVAMGGQWRVRIRRGEQTIYYDGLAATEHRAIQPGDRVKAWAGLDVGIACILVPIPHASAGFVRVGSESL